jgi:hypothetical protein
MTIVNILYKIPNYTTLIFDMSRQFPEPPAGFTDTDPGSLFSVLINKLKFKTNQALMLLSTDANTNLFELLSNSFQKENDLDQNHAIDPAEMNLYINQLYQTWFFCGKAVPIFLHAEKIR